MTVAIDVIANSDGKYTAVLIGLGAGAAPTTIHSSWTELAFRLERVLAVSPERIYDIESQLIGGGNAETGPLEVNLQALKDFGFSVD
jgi:hypothetical protein